MRGAPRTELRAHVPVGGYDTAAHDAAGSCYRQIVALYSLISVVRVGNAAAGMSLSQASRLIGNIGKSGWVSLFETHTSRIHHVLRGRGQRYVAGHTNSNGMRWSGSGQALTCANER